MFLKIDLSSGYHQLKIGVVDITRTKFKTRYNYTEIVLMTFGLINSPATFMDLMICVLTPYLDSFVSLFIDDILVYA